jgi:hypothetical protein
MPLDSFATGGLGRLRHDAFFDKAFTCLNVDLALEHQGDQHINLKNKYHYKKKDPQKAFLLAQARDIYKRNAANRNGVVLVEVPDLAVHTTCRSDAVHLVIQVVRSKINVKQAQAFEARVERLKDDNFVKELIYRCTAECTREAQLRSQLDKEGSPVEILDYDPLSGFFSLFCKKHKVNWQANATNAIGSTDTGRSGTRCPECGELVRREKRRLTFEKLILVAAKKGFRPCFEKEAYVNNSNYLPWECLKCGAGINESWAHLSTDRKCRSCSGTLKRTELAKIEMGEIQKIAECNGDKLLSAVAEYKNQATKLRLKCTREGGCGEEFEMRAQKVKAGQLHGCDKHTRRVITVRGY